MGTGEPHSSGRRSVVPEAAGRSPWRAAIWTGLGAAIVCATLGIVAVAVCWLPVSGSGGRANSAIRAGLLSFVASVHGGVTVDGVAATWLPLGMLLVVGVTAWRAGSGLADAAEALGERDPLRLGLVALAQAAAFTAGTMAAVPFATLGTSRASLPGVGAAAFVVFGLTGGVAFVRSTALRASFGERLSHRLGPVLRAAAAATLVYCAVAAMLIAGSLVAHHGDVQSLSAALGGGLGTLPVLLLGVLAAPNAIGAGVGYLSGPGFTVGSGTTVTLFSSAHGTLPAFPVLGAIPGGPAGPVVWTAAALAAVAAATAITRVACRCERWLASLAVAAFASLGGGAFVFVLTWQGGGSAGDGRLRTIGASPWQTGCAVAAVQLILCTALLGLVAAKRGLTRDDVEWDGPFLPKLSLLSGARRDDTGDERSSDELAG
jgi:Family of unknown function (DUF6350)